MKVSQNEKFWYSSFSCANFFRLYKSHVRKHGKDTIPPILILQALVLQNDVSKELLTFI